MHSLSTSFVLGYHGCSRDVGERLLLNEPFQPSNNSYDWLGNGIYFWESNPDRALAWAVDLMHRSVALNGEVAEPFVVGAVIDPGFCLDMIGSNGASAVEEAYQDFKAVMASDGSPLPRNRGGDDWLLRELDCAVINYLHTVREANGQPPFDTVRGVFLEGDPLYANSGFRRQTHIQICVRNPTMIKGVFRVQPNHFFAAPPAA